MVTTLRIISSAGRPFFGIREVAEVSSHLGGLGRTLLGVALKGQSSVEPDSEPSYGSQLGRAL